MVGSVTTLDDANKTICNVLVWRGGSGGCELFSSGPDRDYPVMDSQTCLEQHSMGSLQLAAGKGGSGTLPWQSCPSISGRVTHNKDTATKD